MKAMLLMSLFWRTALYILHVQSKTTNIRRRTDRGVCLYFKLSCGTYHQTQSTACWYSQPCGHRQTPKARIVEWPFATKTWQDPSPELRGQPCDILEPLIRLPNWTAKNKWHSQIFKALLYQLQRCHSCHSVGRMIPVWLVWMFRNYPKLQFHLSVAALVCALTQLAEIGSSEIPR